jgi:hypothetical protein
MLHFAVQSAPHLTGFILLLILIGFVVAVGAALGVVGRAGWGLFTTLNRTQKTVVEPAVELMERAEGAAERADALAAKAEQLDGAVARLQHDVATLALLTGTLQKAARPWLAVSSYLRK